MWSLTLFAVPADPHTHGPVERGAEEVKSGRSALLQKRLLIRTGRHKLAVLHLNELHYTTMQLVFKA